jgi:hypothetical protein
MITGYEEAIDKQVFKGSTAVWMQTKVGGIHQAHKNLINFAKGVGDPRVVVILVDSKWINRYWFKGDTSIPYSTPSDEQISALEEMGVVPIHWKHPHLTEEYRISRLEWAKKEIKPYESELILPRKIDIAILFCAMFNDLRPEHSLLGHFVGGPGIDHFFLLDYSKDKGFKKYPKNRVLYPKVEKDPLTGLRYQSTTDLLSKDRFEYLPRVRDVIDEARPRFKKGLNQDLVVELNKKIDSKLVRFEDIILYTGGIFGTARLENIGIHVFNPDGGSVLLEDLTLYV